MFDIGLGELAVIAFIAVLVFGPDKLPELARQAGRFLHHAKTFANNARDELRTELGPAYSDLELRDLDPRTIVRKHVIEAMEDAEAESSTKGRAAAPARGGRDPAVRRRGDLTQPVRQCRLGIPAQPLLEADRAAAAVGLEARIVGERRHQRHPAAALGGVLGPVRQALAPREPRPGVEDVHGELEVTDVDQHLEVLAQRHVVEDVGAGLGQGDLRLVDAVRCDSGDPQRLSQGVAGQGHTRRPRTGASSRSGCSSLHPSPGFTRCLRAASSERVRHP